MRKIWQKLGTLDITPMPHLLLGVVRVGRTFSATGPIDDKGIRADCARVWTGTNGPSSKVESVVNGRFTIDFVLSGRYFGGRVSAMAAASELLKRRMRTYVFVPNISCSRSLRWIWLFAMSFTIKSRDYKQSNERELCPNSGRAGLYMSCFTTDIRLSIMIHFEITINWSKYIFDKFWSNTELWGHPFPNFLW